jgi:hypothetical protein
MHTGLRVAEEELYCICLTSDVLFIGCFYQLYEHDPSFLSWSVSKKFV